MNPESQRISELEKRVEELEAAAREILRVDREGWGFEEANKALDELRRVLGE